ncbi:hypothetical protein [Desulfoluna butyratoxydans]|uniref:Uncharacterized protein n=1 Tax=Desulfoluna butyratoxydans TaxID=231438 RepID=A0A4U8YSX0_9BACT|nr:hypothetical protein [Desulfoluna butyratoxydans]VFQ44393.1 hypothetical protein MSL71_20420 [Desulfoluna butyratoxydans]
MATMQTDSHRVTLAATPKKGEAKPTFLKRCVKEKMDGGTKETKAMSECVKGWGIERLAAEGIRHNVRGTVKLEKAEGDGPRRFALVAHTGKVINLRYIRFIVELKGVEYKERFPALRQHNPNLIVGHVDKVECKADTGILLYGPFSKVTDTAAEVLALADEDFPWQASVGIEPREVRWLERGKKTRVNGHEVEGPCEIWTKSFVEEVSWVPLGADDDTAGIALTSDYETNNPTEDDMNPGLRKYLEKLGLAKDASDADAQAFLSTALEDDTQRVQLAKLMTPEGADNEPAPPDSDSSPPPAGGAAGDPSAPAPPPAGGGVDLSAGIQGALKLERERVGTIQNLARQFNLGNEFVDTHVTGGTEEKDIYRLAVDAASKTAPAFGAGTRIEFGEDGSDKFRRLAAVGQGLRMGAYKPSDDSIQKDLDAARQFRGMRLSDMAAMCLENHGHSTRGYTPAEVAQMMFSGKMELAASTSDFRAIFAEVANQHTLRGYNMVTDVHRRLVNVVPANDFREIHGVALDAAQDVELVGENGEYREIKFKERQESYKMGKLGAYVGLSYEMIVNDDTRAFNKSPLLLGQLCRKKEADLVFGLINANPVMKDGKELFHADRGNIATGDAVGPPSHDTLDAGRTFLNGQTIGDVDLDIEPGLILVPPLHRSNTEVMLRSISLAGAENNAGTANIWGDLVPVHNSRLARGSKDAWYLMGDPNMYDGIEMSFLDGKEEPELFEAEEFKSDRILYKIRHVVGVGIMAATAFWRNPGK